MRMQWGQVERLWISGSIRWQGNPMMRFTGIVIASFLLILPALCELGLGMPVAWWLCLAVGIVSWSGGRVVGVEFSPD
jgi:hypothetical protein